MKKVVQACATAASIVAMEPPAFGQAEANTSLNGRKPVLLDEYSAFIGSDDLFSSGGERLTRSWEILRQDRANYHDGLRQHGDGGDTFFATSRNRARLENMMAVSEISEQAAKAIERGRVFIRVQVWGRDDAGDFVRVEME